MPVLGFRNPSKMDRGRGCITSTPNPANFCKKWQKTRKYERDSLYGLARKTQNAPILAKNAKI